MRHRFVMVALVALALGVVANALGITGKASTNQVVSGLALALRDQCISTNISRATDNASHLADYRFITQQIKFTKSTLTADYVALRKVGISKKVLHLALLHSKASLRSEQAQVATKTWTALSDCAAAPSPKEGLRVHSIAARIPPRSARSVVNALRTTPVGSVG